jgi:hypothetical protein
MLDAKVLNTIVKRFGTWNWRCEHRASRSWSVENPEKAEKYTKPREYPGKLLSSGHLIARRVSGWVSRGFVPFENAKHDCNIALAQKAYPMGL